MKEQEKIEILPVELLDRHRAQVTTLKQLARSLRLELGWHYLLDLTWILSQLGPVQGRRIMDAGAGTGLMQWYLAQQGAEVISVDRTSRAALPLRFRRRFHVRGLRSAPQGQGAQAFPRDLLPFYQVIRKNLSGSGRLAVKVKAQARDLLSVAGLSSSPGRVIIYNQDLKTLSDLADSSLDAVVAVSALEHNTPEGLELVVAELLRVLKPGGKLVATLCAGRDQDWFHQPSSGWCYTDTSLRHLFCLPPETPSNYARYDLMLEALKNNAELRSGLASFYSRSGDNGMPWGKWDPQYQPVGVVKVK